MDENEARAGSRLDETLQQALRDARYLIVICSPYSAASGYVAEEIRYFKSLGRAQRILCLVVNGIPSATDAGEPTFECFPPPLRLRVAEDGTQTNEVIPLPERPIAATIGDSTPAELGRAIDQICSGLLDLPVSAYVKEAKGHRFLMRSLQISVVVVAMTSATAYYLAFHHPTVSLYRDFVERWGIPQGIDPVKASDLNATETAIEATRWGWFGPIRQLRVVDHRGRCAQGKPFASVLSDEFDTACSASRACAQTYEYASSGGLAKLDIRDQFDQSLETLTYADTTRAILQQAVLSCSRTRSGVSYVVFKHHEDGATAGLVERVTFHDSRGPRANSLGAFGEAFEYDSVGRQISYRSLRRDGSNFADKNGNAGRRTKYDDKGNAIEIQYFGVDGAPFTDNQGFAGWRSRYDERGNEIERIHVNEQGQPALTKEGIAGWRASFDENGNQNEVEYIEIEGALTLSKQGINGWRARFDEHGNQIAEDYVGLDRQPTLDNTGVAGLRVKYDQPGDPIVTTLVGLDGNPTLNAEGLAGWQSKYDTLGNEIERRFLGLDGSPAADKLGIAAWRHGYDDVGNRVREAWFDKVGRTVRGGDYQVPMVERKFDKTTGKMLETRFVDSEGRLTLGNDGTAGWRAKHDERGNEIENRSFDLDGAPVSDNTGAVAIHARHDERGNQIEFMYLGANGQPVLSSDGYATSRSKYDERGNEVEEAHFGIDGSPVVLSDGYAGWSAKFDSRGNQTESRYLGVDGLPTLNTQGVAGWRAKHDSYAKQIELTYFDVNGGPILSNDGYAGWKSEFDKFGNEVHVDRLGLDGRLILGGDGLAGWRVKFDARGNQLEQAYFGLDHKPVLDDEGVAGWRAKYDERGNQLELAYFGIDGAPVNQSNGFAGWRSKYDVRGHEIEKVFFGVDGLPTETANGGFAKRQVVVDERGNELEVTYFDARGDRVARIWGGGVVSRWIREYDDFGRVTRESFFDMHDKPINTERGMHALKYVVNRYGSVEEILCHDAAGKVVTTNCDASERE